MEPITLHRGGIVYRDDGAPEAAHAAGALDDTEDASVKLNEAGRFWVAYFCGMALLVAVILGVHAWHSGWFK